MAWKHEPDSGRDLLDKDLAGLKVFWFSVIVGLMAFSGFLTLSGYDPLHDDPNMGYLFLLAVPLGLVGAFVVAPAAGSIVIRKMRDSGRSDEISRDDSTCDFPGYRMESTMRMLILAGAGAPSAYGLAATGNWAALAGAAVMAFVLIASMPNRAKYDAWVEAAEKRTAS